MDKINNFPILVYLLKQLKKILAAMRLELMTCSSQVHRLISYTTKLELQTYIQQFELINSILQKAMLSGGCVIH